MKRPTQHDRVLAMLEAHPAGICSTLFYKGDEWGPLPHARNRISERVRARGLLAQGYHIESFPCPDESHEASYFRYVLLHGRDRRCGAKCPTPLPEQLTIAAIG